jgi:hypothetical protein
MKKHASFFKKAWTINIDIANFRFVRIRSNYLILPEATKTIELEL